ncbi:MAG: hypothetical protein CBC16_08890 [Verrucomicrobia bacterium TMED56]|nr:MAG: hypothetical protein CBC16_08890 [Verrucomicrobia bacterium TMED56]|tara:strand:+ start:172 stop:1056 length:885 start_codon:yes stop_codon:yes gene_type:complete
MTAFENVKFLGVKKMKVSDIKLPETNNKTVRGLFSQDFEIKQVERNLKFFDFYDKSKKEEKEILEYKNSVIDIIKRLDKVLPSRLHCGHLVDFRMDRLDELADRQIGKVGETIEDIIHCMSIYFNPKLAKQFLTPKKEALKGATFSLKRTFEKKNKDIFWKGYCKSFATNLGSEYFQCISIPLPFTLYTGMCISLFMDGYLTLLDKQDGKGDDYISRLDNTCFILSCLDFYQLHKNYEGLKNISQEEMEDLNSNIFKVNERQKLEDMVDLEKIKNYRGKLLGLLYNSENTSTVN